MNSTHKSKKNNNMTRTSGRHQKSGGGINIDLSEIKYDSTCTSIALPFDMSCDVCRPKMKAATGLTKKRLQT